MGIKAVSFDFWNTLFTEQPGGFDLYKSRRHRLLGEALSGCGEFTLDQLETACSAEARSHNDIWRGEHRTLSAAERVGKILSHLGACLPDDVLAQLVRDYEEGILEHPPILIEGAKQAVEELAARYRLGVISDVGFSPGRVLKRLLDENGLLRYFDSLVFSDEAGRSKPHAEVFNLTAARLGARPREIVHVGDLEFTDVVGAKGAGCRAIRFTGATPMLPGEQTIADRVTENILDVPRIVEALDRS